jgi:hypothetical protein
VCLGKCVKDIYEMQAPIGQILLQWYGAKTDGQWRGCTPISEVLVTGPVIFIFLNFFLGMNVWSEKSVYI